jgi:mono/diheme cytochrome c family protein
MILSKRGRMGAICALLCAALLSVSLRPSAQNASDNVSTFSDVVDHFKYGSIGTEGRVGLPYWIWRVLPIVFADKLPNRPGEGYERIGFMSDGASHGRPIGTTYKEDRVALVGLNCATCHVGSIRYAPAEKRQIVVGMPANQMDLQAYARFLTACANDPRFNAATLLPAIQKINPEFGFFKRLFYRLFVIGRARDGILERARENAWFDVRPPQGPGRVDTFNPYKVLLRMGIDKDPTVGTVDLPSLWNQRPREGLWLHWDGNNNSVEERNKSAAIGAGATPDSLDLPAMKRIEDWIMDLKPPAYPADRIDKALAEQGAKTYQTECASCHEFNGSRIGQVTDAKEIDTDRERLESFSAELAKRMNTIGEGRPWKFSHFRKTDGYANAPLDGLWLRAPYLHNGSVPHLRALLFPEQRPVEFYRAYDVYDWKNVGFVSSGPDAEREGVRYSTKDRGNGNGGHLYGTKLDAATKEALLEYLKTK